VNFKEIVVNKISEFTSHCEHNDIYTLLDCYHLLFIIEGKGTIFMEECEYIVDRDNVFICPTGKRYKFLSDSVTTKIIKVEFLIHNLELRNYYQYVYFSGRGDKKFNWIKAMLEISIQEVQNKTELYKDSINIIVFNVLFRILKIQTSEAAGNKRESKIKYEASGENSVLDSLHRNIDFNKILEYINNHLNLPINLNDIACLVGLNASYFCRVFKEKYGISPMHYINILRLEKAKGLLLHSELNISEIADNVGFQTVHYFSRFFKSKVKISPSEYKTRGKNDYFIEQQSL
jgi:AraC-like DNA-binding protein